MSQPVYPQSVEEVRQLVQAAAAAAKPLYIYRQNHPEGTILDVSRLDEIVEIDAANLVAIVRPGVKLGVLAARLAEQGLRFLPADTPFYQDKTVGQFFYEGCSNLSSLKYGSAKHFLLGSEVVLPSGELLKTGGKTVKNVTGYDFTRFFNAPYADLGITVTLLLKLLPLPETRKGLAVAFAEVEQLLDFVREVKENHLVPAYLLWFDRQVQALLQQDLPGSLVLLEFDGLAEETAEQQAAAVRLAGKYGASICEADAGQRPAVWSRLYQAAAIRLVTDEYKLKFTCQAEFIRSFYDITKQSGIAAGLFGQVAEGKLDIALAAEPAEAFLAAVSAAVRKSGGIASGKYERLAGKRPTGGLARLEQRIKQALDPQQLLNPLPLREVE